MIVERRAVRALLLTSEGEILLMRIRPLYGRSRFWIAPGGGLEAGEGAEDALRRELREELGLQDFEMGPLVWRRHHTFTWGDRRISQHEEYYVVRVQRFEPSMSDEEEAQVLDDFRWWPARALTTCDEVLAPSCLAKIVADYLTHGAPTGPLEVERQID
ncbi:MAG: NUDIX domain-containing protein [Hyphomonadaceae bacterium]